MNRRFVFVLSDVRSGSTLLDQLLGAHSAIMSVGEVHWLPAYVNRDRTIYDPVHELACTCGHSITDCRFWTQVAAKLRTPLQSLQLRPAFMDWSRRGRSSNYFARMPRRILGTYPRAFRRRSIQRIFGGHHLVPDSIALFDAIITVSDRPCVVDSSKSAYRFRAVCDSEPTATCALLLARDYRAVVHSKMKRGATLEAAGIGWRNRMAQIAALTDDLPAGRTFRLKYEDLCEDPARELTRVCHFLGLEFSPVMLERPTKDTHHIGGSPSKFDKSRAKISMDQDYKKAFDPASLSKLRNLVGNIALDWGY